MTLIFTAKLGISPRQTGVGAQKINSLPLEIYNIVFIGFSVQDKLGIIWFFKIIFLLTNTSIEVVWRMFFLVFSNADIQFNAKSLTWRLYTTTEALPTARWVELINKHKFVKATLNKNSE